MLFTLFSFKSNVNQFFFSCCKYISIFTFYTLHGMHGNRRRDTARAHTHTRTHYDRRTDYSSTGPHTRCNIYIENFMAENICNFSSGHQINRLRLHCTLIAPNKLFIQNVSNFWSSRRCRRTTLAKNKIQLNVVAAIWTSTNSVSTAAKCQVVAVHSPMILLVIDAWLTVVELSTHSLSALIFHAAKHWQTIVNEQ